MNCVWIQTTGGSYRATFSARGLTALDFARSAGRAEAVPPRPAGRAGKGRSRQFTAWQRRLRRELKQYARGQPVRWSVPLDVSAGTPFQQQVWRALQRIPRGQTRSYAWVARAVHRPRAARAVGAACGANPIPVLVPCHRVIAADGTLGGYSGGLERKRELLALERAYLPPAA